MFSPTQNLNLWKSWGSRIYSRQQNVWGSFALILPYHFCNFTRLHLDWTVQGPSLAIRTILEGIPVQSRGQRLRKAGIFLSYWAAAEHATSLPIFLQWGLFCYVLLIFLCNFTKIHLWTNLWAACDKVQESFLLWAAKTLPMWQLHGWGSAASDWGKARDTLEKNCEIQL